MDNNAMNIEQARKEVAKDFLDNAYALREEDPYASHVSEWEKDQWLLDSIIHAQSVERGELDHNFTIKQRIQYKMTGKTVALLH